MGDFRLQIADFRLIPGLESAICNLKSAIRLIGSVRAAELRSAGQPRAAVPTRKTWETASGESRRVLVRKTKRPRLDLSLGTSVDQPSPKCCSRTTLTPRPDSWNGSRVLRHGTNGDPWKTCFARKTKRPRLNLSLGTSVDQPSPKCCSRTTLVPTPESGKWLTRAIYGTKVVGGRKRPETLQETR